jgi:hypothetical protein
MKDWEDSEINFTEMASLDAHISREEALATLRCQRSETAMSTVSAARYGVMRIENRAQQFPEGRLEPPVWVWPVWIVTLPDQRRSRGGRGLGARPINYVVDAESGEYLFAFP